MKHLYSALWRTERFAWDYDNKRKTNKLGWVGKQKCLEKAFEYRQRDRPSQTRGELIPLARGSYGEWAIPSFPSSSRNGKPGLISWWAESLPVCISSIGVVGMNKFNQIWWRLGEEDFVYMGENFEGYTFFNREPMQRCKQAGRRQVTATRKY